MTTRYLVSQAMADYPQASHSNLVCISLSSARVPALGLNPSFITDLADAVIEALPFAKAMYASTSTSEEEHDPLRYLVKMFFGSILAFILFLSPRMIN
ncbi:hypothetical protein HN51_069965 [Arachis hypogaea]